MVASIDLWPGISREPFQEFHSYDSSPESLFVYERVEAFLPPCTPLTVNYPGDRVSHKELPAQIYETCWLSEMELSKGHPQA